MVAEPHLGRFRNPDGTLRQPPATNADSEVEVATNTAVPAEEGEAAADAERVAAV